MARRLVPLRTAATYLGVTDRTVGNYIGRGFFPAYHVAGRRSHYVDLDEVDRALAATPRLRARPKTTKKFGPKATIIALPAQPEVVRPEAQR